MSTPSPTPTVAQCVAALAQIESSNNPLAWGDYVDKDGTPTGHPDPAAAFEAGFLPQAMGRWQVHPDALDDWAQRLRLYPNLDETWDSYVRRIVGAIFAYYIIKRTPVEIAMCWHVGHWVSASASGWDTAYAGKFTAALAAITAGG